MVFLDRTLNLTFLWQRSSTHFKFKTFEIFMIRLNFQWIQIILMLKRQIKTLQPNTIQVYFWRSNVDIRRKASTFLRFFDDQRDRLPGSFHRWNETSRSSVVVDWCFWSGKMNHINIYFFKQCFVIVGQLLFLILIEEVSALKKQKGHLNSVLKRSH